MWPKEDWTFLQHLPKTQAQVSKHQAHMAWLAQSPLTARWVLSPRPGGKHQVHRTCLVWPAPEHTQILYLASMQLRVRTNAE